jgi:ABC-type sugar transport system ATPase subunit
VTDAPVVEVAGLRKEYGSVQALRGVDLALYPGEIVGLLGANGAGKSTLIKAIAGLEHADEGTVSVDGEELSRHKGVKAARTAGISVVPQELNLVMTASVAENVLLWGLPTRGGLVNTRAMRRRAREVLAELGVELDVEREASSLTAVEQRLVMVAAAVSQHARVLILDEPTAALPPHEAKHVLDVARQVRTLGKTVLFVSHRLGEVSGLVDRAVVMREGRVIAELREGELEVSKMVDRLGGVRPATPAAAPTDTTVGSARLAARGLSGRRVSGVDVEVRAGEIVGIAGLVGAGRSELIRLLAGVQDTTGGDVLLDGEPLRSVSGLRHKVGYIGEDRNTSLFRDFDITGNMTLPSLKRFSRARMVRRRPEIAATREVVERIQIKGNPTTNVLGLSGGNRQKVLLGRWLMSGADVLLLDEPTAGLDPSARAEVHRLLRALVDDDGAVVVAIAEPAELLALCDRVVVMREGRISHVASRPFDEREILAASYDEPEAVTMEAK